jgi:hypothetical protein
LRLPAPIGRTYGGGLVNRELTASLTSAFDTDYTHSTDWAAPFHTALGRDESENVSPYCTELDLIW